MVSSAIEHEPSPGLDELSLCCESVSGVIPKSTTHSVCVNELVGIDHVMSEGVDGQSHKHASDDKGMSDNKMNSEITRLWELESQGPVQITDVQDCLKQRLPFWREVLHTPPHILECIEHGYLKIHSPTPHPT